MFVYLFYDYFQSRHTTDIRTSVLYVRGKPTVVSMDYLIAMTGADKESYPKIEDTIR